MKLCLTVVILAALTAASAVLAARQRRDGVFHPVKAQSAAMLLQDLSPPWLELMTETEPFVASVIAQNILLRHFYAQVTYHGPPVTFEKDAARACLAYERAARLAMHIMASEKQPYPEFSMENAQPAGWHQERCNKVLGEEEEEGLSHKDYERLKRARLLSMMPSLLVGQF